jgi:predicted secreted hydrolase
MAGHALDPLRVWIDGNRLEWKGGEADGESVSLSLGEGNVAGSLQFAVEKPRLASSESGLSQGPWSGYLYPRLRVSGDIRVERTQQAVEGGGWLWHHWGPMPPLGGQVVFDRWLMQFDQGQELAVFQTRRRDGTGTPSQRGVWIAADGRAKSLEPGELRLQPKDLKGNHPAGWTLDSFDGQIKLRITATTGQDEGTALGQGWVGAIQVEGEEAARAVSGWGFVELGAN